MILGFTKHAWGKHNLFIKLGGGTLGFIGENLGRAKGKFFFFFFVSLMGLFFIMVFQRV
jgi:hypothetical protein